MDQCFDFLVALDRFDVLKVNEDERQCGQHHRQTKRKDEPETRVAFSFGLHCRPENTPGQRRAVSSVSKNLLRVVNSELSSHLYDFGAFVVKSAAMESTVKHLTMQELEAALDHLRQAPKDEGVLQLIVCRPEVDQREVLDEAELDLEKGLIGDNWFVRGSTKTPDGSAHPEMQINIMNSRVTALVAQEKERWPLAGDQLYIDMDLGHENLPPGSHLAIGSAVLEVSRTASHGLSKIRLALWC